MEYIMMSAEEVRKFQEQQQERLSINKIEEIELEKIQKEIMYFFIFSKIQHIISHDHIHSYYLY
jgi:hypothetical protein